MLSYVAEKEWPGETGAVNGEEQTHEPHAPSAPTQNVTTRTSTDSTQTRTSQLKIRHKLVYPVSMMLFPVDVVPQRARARSSGNLLLARTGTSMIIHPCYPSVEEDS